MAPLIRVLEQIADAIEESRSIDAILNAWPTNITSTHPVKAVIDTSSRSRSTRPVDLANDRPLHDVVDVVRSPPA